MKWYKEKKPKSSRTIKGILKKMPNSLNRSQKSGDKKSKGTEKKYSKIRDINAIITLNVFSKIYLKFI